MGKIRIITASLAATIAGSWFAYAQQGSPEHPMTFFITSTGMGDGGNFGGLAGADAHCQLLASRGRRRQQNLARLSQHAGASRPTGDQCARPHRHGSLVQCQWRDDRAGSRASAWRYARTRAARQQHHQADQPHGKGADRVLAWEISGTHDRDNTIAYVHAARPTPIATKP